MIKTIGNWYYIPVVLSREEVDRIIARLDEPYMLVVKLLYGCGLRLFECLQLRVHPSSTVCPSISSLFLNKNNMLTEKPKAVVVARPCLISG